MQTSAIGQARRYGWEISDSAEVRISSTTVHKCYFDRLTVLCRKCTENCVRNSPRLPFDILQECCDCTDYMYMYLHLEHCLSFRLT